MDVGLVWEHNGGDTILYAAEYPGAFARGPSFASARDKMDGEIRAFLRWSGGEYPESVNTRIIQEKSSDLRIADADSDVIFDAEQLPLPVGEYERLKMLALKSASDFQRLYDAIPDQDSSCLPQRSTFYGPVPRTAREMYIHTKNVNEYYFWEIGVDADNDGTIEDCRRRGFEKLETIPGFLDKPPAEGSYGEVWSLRKVLRRFIWHDRIHAKAMYRMAVKTFGKESVPDIFYFETERRDIYGMA